MTASNEGVVARYAPALVYDNPYSRESRPGMDKESWGEYVLHSDYSALQAELDAAKKELHEWLARALDQHDRLLLAQQEHAALVAGVEGLREKASITATKAQERLDAIDDDEAAGLQDTIVITTLQAAIRLSRDWEADLRALLAGRS